MQKCCVIKWSSYIGIGVLYSRYIGYWISTARNKQLSDKTHVCRNRVFVVGFTQAHEKCAMKWRKKRHMLNNKALSEKRQDGSQ